MSRGSALHLRTEAAIIDSAARILAARGEAASMTDIAASAGIGRATLYRYFPNREDLLRAMALTSIQDLAERIEHANLEAVSLPEGVSRLARALVSTGSKYIALSRDSKNHSQAHPDFNARVTEPIRAFFRRATADGSLRDDVPAEVLLDLFSGLVSGALAGMASRHLGIEETASAVTTVFLRGVNVP